MISHISHDFRCSNKRYLKSLCFRFTHFIWSFPGSNFTHLPQFPHSPPLRQLLRSLGTILPEPLHKHRLPDRFEGLVFLSEQLDLVIECGKNGGDGVLFGERREKEFILTDLICAYICLSSSKTVCIYILLKAFLKQCIVDEVIV